MLDGDALRLNTLGESVPLKNKLKFIETEKSLKNYFIKKTTKINI